MKFFRLFLLISLFFPVASQAGLLSISEQQINHYLATQLHEKIPRQDRIGLPGLFQLEYRLQHISTKIGHTDEKRIEILGNVEGTLQAKGKSFDAQITLNMDAVPNYDAEKGALFLKDVRLTQWEISPEKYQRELQTFLPLLSDGIRHILDRYPVYVLDENKTKEALLKKVGKRIIVEKGQLRLETVLF